MSLKAMLWAMSQKNITPSEKLTLLSLAEHCNETDGKWEAWPSQTKLESDTCLNIKTIKKCLSTLQDKNLLIKTGKCRGRTQRVRVYFLPLETSPNLDLFEDQKTAQKRANFNDETSPNLDVLEGDKHAQNWADFDDGISPNFPPNKPNLGPTNKPNLGLQNQEEEPGRRTRNNNPPNPPGGGGCSFPEFEKFWEAYPRSGRKRDAKSHVLKKWTTKKLESKPGEVLAGLERWKKTDDWQKSGGQYVPGPAKFLNQSLWGAEAQASVKNHKDKIFTGAV